ncbi:unnamed protein product [Lampetra planeri]
MKIIVALNHVPALLAFTLVSLTLLILTYNILVDSTPHQAHPKLRAILRSTGADQGHPSQAESELPWLDGTGRGDPNTAFSGPKFHHQQQQRHEQQHQQQQHQQLFPRLWDESSMNGAPSWDGRSARCLPNATVAHAVEGFASLSQAVQDFLTHRHCRSFGLILQPDGSKCDSRPNVTLLLAIKSDARNLARRDVIRRTWGREGNARGRPVRRVFLVGVPSGETPERRVHLNALLQQESREHGDIVQWNFLDTFFNLTLKQLLFLDWLHERCAGARYVLDGDDDVFVNTPNLLERIAAEERAGRGDGHLYEGYVISNVGPIRAPSSKYFVPVQVHAGESYPPYVGGGGILMAGRTALDIRRVAGQLAVLPIDDVFLGQCLAALGLAPTRHPAFRTAGISLPAPKRAALVSSFHPCYYREAILVHRVEPFQTLIMWAALRDPHLRCGRP